MTKSPGWNGWNWPEEGRDPEVLRELLSSIDSPYNANPPPFCYPGTPLRDEIAHMAAPLLVRHLNAIGVHTQGEVVGGSIKFQDGEGGFEQAQRMEAEAVWMLASVMGGTPAVVDGFFCGGGTEANLQGMWVGREYLRQTTYDALDLGTAVLTTQAAHYSIAKGAMVLDIARPQWKICSTCKKDHLLDSEARSGQFFYVPMSPDGSMSVEGLEETIMGLEGNGYRRFLIVATVGTCAMGAVDPIAEIARVIAGHKNCYLHVDASFGGFIVPFLAPDIRFGFDVPGVQSVAIDGDKMGGLPYPAGIFLCRKGLLDLVSQPINYVRGHTDQTLPGSRSAIAPLLAWYLMRSRGTKEHRYDVERSVRARDLLAQMLAARFEGDKRIKLWPHHPATPFLPIEVNIENGAIPEHLREKPGILAPYELRSDYLPRDPGNPRGCPATVYKLCLMPHTIPYLGRFVDDLAKAMQN